MSTKASIPEEKRVKPQKSEHKPKSAKAKPKLKTVDALSDESGLAKMSVQLDGDEAPSEPHDTYRIGDDGKLVCVLGGKPRTPGCCVAYFDIKKEEHLRDFAKCIRPLFAKFPQNADAIADALVSVMTFGLYEDEINRLAESVLEEGYRFEPVPPDQGWVAKRAVVSNVSGFYEVLCEFITEPSLANRCALAVLSEDLSHAVHCFAGEYRAELANPTADALE